jgi:uncharacterized delta-60 repeat protein
LLLALLVAGAALVAVPGALTLAPAARAATAAGPGSLDPTFGDGGRVLAATIPETSPAEFTAAAREPNGNLVFEIRHETFNRASVEIEMRTPTGALVPTFGAGGRIALEDEDEGRPRGLTVLGNGDIAIGVRTCGGRPSSIEMLDPTGARVSGFGSDGCAPAFDFDPSVVTTDPQGRILVAGERNYCSPCGKDTIPDAEAAVGRLLPDGSHDLGFGKEGLVGVHATLKLGPERSGELGATTVGATADGGMLLSTADELIRLDPSGALDMAYGKGGVVTTPDYMVAMLAEADGSAVVVGGSSLTRFTPTGTPDPGFGKEGTVSTSGEQIAPESGGGYLLAGQERAPVGCRPCEWTPFLTRLTAAGQPDPAYGVGGVAAVHLTAPRRPAPAVPTRLLVNPDGSAIVAGANYEQEAFAAAFTPAGAVDPSFGEHGVVVEHFEQPAQLEPTGLALNADDGLTLVNARSTAPGLLSGFRADFDADGRQLPAPNGAPAVETLTHGAIAPLGGGAVAVAFQLRNRPESVRVLESAGPDGLPVAGFGEGGIARFPPGFAAEQIFPAPDGGVLAVGSFRPKKKTKGPTMAIYRLASNGQPLRGFGRQGLATVRFAGAESKALAGLVEAHGDVVVTGAVGDGVGAARLLPSGRLDRHFGHAGRVRGLLAGGSSGTLVAPWHGGVVIAAGWPRGAGGLIRLDPRGHLVHGFGKGGVVRKVPENAPLALFTGKGRIVTVTDPISEKGHKGNGVELRSYRPDGTVDQAFGNRGVRLFESGRGRERHTFVPAAAVQQSGGGIVVAGTAVGGNLGADRTSAAATQAELVRFLVR